MASSPFRLTLLRHAQSGAPTPGQRDFDRTLDATGYAQAEVIADIAADKGFRPHIVLCSTATRCRQTAEAFYRAMGEDLDIRYIDGLYSGTLDLYRDLILSHAHLPSVMLIGHNPVMEELLHDLLGDAAPAEGYPTAALAVLDIDRDIDLDATDGLAARGRLVAWLHP